MSDLSNRIVTDQPGEPSTTSADTAALSSRLQVPEPDVNSEDSTGATLSPKRKNAFEELMAAKKKPKPAVDDREKTRPKTTVSPKGAAYFGRDGLLAYIQEPDSFSRVIYHNDNWVLLHDMYPKASVHLLLLPRHPEFHSLHPLHVFENEKFLAAARIEVAKAKDIAASELRRLLGSYSYTERERIEAMEAEDPPAQLPRGRNWAMEIKTGVHANPSMNHVHIHIISRDMHSECLKRREHYNSFNTRFFCKMKDMPMSRMEQARRRQGAREDFDKDMECWRCGAKYSMISKLKRHLEEEFRQWREE